jgi:hypothetical protein
VKLPWWGWGVAVILAVFWFRAHDAQIRAESKLLATRDSLIVQREALFRSEHLRAAADKEARANLTLREDRIAWAELRRDSLNAVEAVARAELRAVLPPTLLPQFDALTRVEALHDTAADSIMADLKAQRDTALAGWNRADSAASRWAAISQGWEAQSAAWEKRARPGMLEQARRGLPWLAAGLVAGLLLSR